ncbi:S-adenosyl-L-methionine-dependent methyltransferase [Halteromyces radiatus]|uniref:S-adenosyl-L-methionine-dependent methyltransferase n=1 Tax=Halteromyces radiatus TaxID=101107 RepID=UPI00221FBF10|nr:S-adenosyl-L-methionine-dependent methyltransferase [Halteromyces radiatus]KAI8093218.1 S-adenosyl-L-methionine-dependent methyltransferase [Halteromyces radiatus]
MGSGFSRLQKKNNISQHFADRTNGSDTMDGASSFTSYSAKSSEFKCSSIENTSYWLPKSYEEQDRLMGQHFALKESFGGNVLQNAKKVTPLEEGAHILDIGCGPGSWCLEMATDYPNCEVYGIDIYAVYPQTIRPPNSTFMLADALEGLPFHDEMFDLVQIRLMVAAIKVNEWPKLIKEAMRVLKPGGILQMIEPDYRDSGGGASQLLVRTVIRLCEERGQDPHVGSRLEDLMRNAGLVILDSISSVLDHSDGGKLVSEWTYDWKVFATVSRPILEVATGLSGDKYSYFLKQIEPSMKQFHFKTYGNAVSGQKSSI